MAAHTVNLVGKNGHDFNEVKAKLFGGGFCEGRFEDSDLNVEGSAEKKDDF